MDTSRSCPICRTALPGDAPKGLCPRCLVARGLDGTGDDSCGRAAGTSDGGSSGKLPGRVVGDYELLMEIASGGMGVVYGARQRRPNRSVALKMIRSGQLATADEVRRFRSEAEAAANLDHPHIVPIYEVGEHEGQPYFSMKLIEGGNLAELNGTCRDRGAAWVRRAAGLLASIARAVHHAHQRGLLHRDIKPTNILMDEQDRPHLTDFGLAKWIGRHQGVSTTQSTVGTPYYMAPEQAAGNAGQLTTAADVYSLGAVLYELLAGRPPFEGDSPFEIVKRAQECEPAPPRSINPEVDRDVETICLKCLEKTPERRYSSAEALAEDLERWLGGEPIRARPSGPAERAAKWARRNPVVTGLASAALLILLAGAIGVLLQWRRAETNAEQARTKENESRERLVRLNIANGIRLLDDGDSLGSLVWFAEALKLDQGRADPEANHRLRLASVIRQGPQLLHVWFPGGPVQTAEFSQDGRFILTASGSNTVRIWSTESGEPVAPPMIHGSGEKVFANTWAREWVVSGNGDTAKVWSGKTGQWVREVLHARVGHAALGPDGMRIATGSRDGSVRVWSVPSGENLFGDLQHSNAVAEVSFSGDGKRLLSLDRSGRIYLWDATDGRPLIPSWRPKGEVRHAEFDPAGQSIVTAHADGVAHVWDVTTGKLIASTKKESTWLTHAAFSPDGKRIVTSAGGHVARVWDATTGQAVAQLSGHKNVVVSGAFSPDGQKVVTCSFDGTARVHEAGTGKALSAPIRHGGLVTSARFHPDGERVLTASADGTVRLWSIGPVTRFALPWGGEPMRAVNVSRGGDALLVQDGSNVLQAWSTRTWKPISKPVLLPDFACQAWLDRDQRRLLSVSYAQERRGREFEIMTWEVATGALLTRVATECEPGDSLVPSADLNQVAVYGSNRVQVLETRSAKPILPRLNFPQRVGTVWFSPDGQHLLVTSGNATQVIGLKTGRPLFPPLQHQCAVSYAEFSGDGRRIVSCGLDSLLTPREAQVWDAWTGRPVGPALRHGDGVFSAAFSPGDRSVVTASEDNTARLWDVESGRPLTPPLRHSVAVHDATVSPDGRWIATASQDKTARVWDARTGEPLTPRLKHDWRVDHAVFLADGHYLLTIRGFAVTIWELPTDARPVEDLVSLAALLSGHGIDSTGALVPLEEPAMRSAWAKLRAKYPADFTFNPRRDPRTGDQ
jgi:WD40 repeat protein